MSSVTPAKADLATKRAEAKYDPDKASPDALVSAVNKAGFRASIKP